MYWGNKVFTTYMEVFLSLAIVGAFYVATSITAEERHAEQEQRIAAYYERKSRET